MKLEDLPDFAKPYKTKGFDVRKIKNSYQLYKISSKRVEGKKYPVQSQTYIGTIDPEKGLIPKRTSNTPESEPLVEYGLSNFIYTMFKDELAKTIADKDSADSYIKIAIIYFMYGHIEERFVNLSYLGKDIELTEEFASDKSVELIKTLSDTITVLFAKLISNSADRDYLIACLRDIKKQRTVENVKVNYPNHILDVFAKYAIDNNGNKIAFSLTEQR